MSDMASSDVDPRGPRPAVARCSIGFSQGNIESGVIAAVREALTGLGAVRPTMAVVCVAAPGDPITGGRILGHAGALLAEAAPDCAIIGTTAHGVIGGVDAVEMQPAVSVWLASWSGAPPRPFRVAARPTEGGFGLTGLPDITDSDRLAVCFVDPWTTPIDEVLAAFTRIDGDLPVVGGFASAGQRGENRLLLGSAVLDSGTVGLIIDSAAPVRAVVSHGCRPIGDPMTVTSSRGAFLIEMAGRPALERIRAAVAALPPEEQALAVRGLQMGIARAPEAGGDTAADYLMRAIIGIDPTIGAVTVGDEVPVGSLVRLHLRDADSADADLRQTVDAVAQGGTSAGGLVITCNGRGRSMFTSPSHDSEVVTAGIGSQAVGGFFAAGEIGPVGGGNHLHGFTAVLLVVDSMMSDAVEVPRVEKSGEAGVDGAGALAEVDTDFDAELASLLDTEPPSEPPRT
jgi:small ligand-binding sensory domain FIST